MTGDGGDRGPDGRTGNGGGTTGPDPAGAAGAEAATVVHTLPGAGPGPGEEATEVHALPGRGAAGPPPAAAPGHPATPRGPAGYGPPGGTPAYGPPGGYGGYGPAAPHGSGAAGPPPGTRAWTPPGPPGSSPGFGAPAFGPPGGPPPAAAARPRRRWPLVAALVAVLALAAGAVTAVALLSRGGGGDTPGQAVELLAADLGEGALIDAASRLHPAEVTLATDVGEILAAELQRLDVLRADADPQALYGSLTVEGLRFDAAQEERVRDDVVITKLVAGRITITQDPGALPFTDSFRARAFPDGLPPAGEPMTIDVAEVVAEQGEPVRLATVQVDGAWYVSVFYTLADYALLSEGLEWPRTTIEPRGAASPQDALRETLQAVLDADVRRLVELAPPGELDVLHAVGDVLVAQAADGEAPGGRVVDVVTEPVEVRGQDALRITRLVFESPEGQEVTVARSGDCLEVSAAGAPSERFCAEDAIAGSDLGSAPPEVADIATRLVGTALDLKVVTVEVDGAHYVSPIRTAVGVYADLLGTLTAEDLAALFAAAG